MQIPTRQWGQVELEIERGVDNKVMYFNLFGAYSLDNFRELSEEEVDELLEEYISDIMLAIKMEIESNMPDTITPQNKEKMQ